MTVAPSHRYGYRGGGAARDRAAAGTAGADAAGEAPGEPAGPAAWSSGSVHSEKPHPGDVGAIRNGSLLSHPPTAHSKKPHPRHIVPVRDTRDTPTGARAGGGRPG